jgi:hypothetical protein
VDFATALITARPSIFIAAAWICSRNRPLGRLYVLELLHHNMLGLSIKNPDAAKTFN